MILQQDEFPRLIERLQAIELSSSNCDEVLSKLNEALCVNHWTYNVEVKDISLYELTLSIGNWIPGQTGDQNMSFFEIFDKKVVYISSMRDLGAGLARIINIYKTYTEPSPTIVEQVLDINKEESKEEAPPSKNNLLKDLENISKRIP